MKTHQPTLLHALPPVPHRLRVVTQHEQWAQRIAATVGKRVRELRSATDVKLSAQALSDRTTELGYTVTRTVIADMESGRRKQVLVPELLALAAALEVPPSLLLLEEFPDGGVEVLPDRVVDGVTALAWIAGTAPLPDPAPDTREKFVELVQLATERQQKALTSQLRPGYQVYYSTHISEESNEAAARLVKLQREWERQLEMITAERDRLEQQIRDLGGVIHSTSAGTD